MLIAVSDILAILPGTKGTTIVQMDLSQKRPVLARLEFDFSRVGPSRSSEVSKET
jgi:hypothetical protein